MTEYDERVPIRESNEPEASNENRSLRSEAADFSELAAPALFDLDKGQPGPKSIELNQAITSSGLQAANSPAGDSGVIMYRVAGFWIRLGAFIIDLLVIAGLNAIIWDLLLPAGSIPGFINRIVHVNALFLGVTGALYFIFMTYYFQQTLGKMIVGIKVVQRNGEPLNWITVIFRELVARSLSQIMGLNLGYIVCWFNAEKRCVHDLLSDTWVVYEKKQSESGYIAVTSSRA